ncbi:cytidylate kinase [Gigaspora margarita]|uniref:(d)CMP kinase n=1 Tax=Gigaspora margarita TaxID=4874 RepID=A0A8H4EQN5_GIGMA|nr:cytidylate kinase [Gigaspora margarita]
MNITIDGLYVVGKLVIGKRLAKQLGYMFIDKFNIVYNLDKSTYMLNGKRAAQLAKNNKIQKVINEIIKVFTSSKGFVVAGFNISINIIPDADIKIVLTADLTTCIARRYLENYDDYRRDASLNIISDAAIKIVLTADLTTCIARRYLENYDVMMSKSSLDYYAIKTEHKTGIYMNW